MKRRVFLKGVAGAALATPFLSSLRRSAEAQAADPPRRLVIFYTTAGCLTNRWFPKLEHGVVDAAALAGTTLEPLAGFADKLLFPRGLAMYPRGPVSVEGATYFDPHDQAMGSKLTAAPIDPGGEHWALGRSLDHVAAELVNPAQNGPLVLSVAHATVNVKSILSYAGARAPHPPLIEPRRVYSSLTGVFAGGAATEADYRVARGQSVIDIVRDDLESYRRLPMSAGDQQRIEDWLALLRETEQAVCRKNVAKLGITEQELEAASSTDTATAFTLGGDLMLKLIALTMICDANRSIVLQWPGYVRFDWDGISHAYDHQGLSHRNGSAAVGGNCIPGVLGMLREIDEWYARRYSQLLALVDGFPEGERTMLDNSAIVWLPELADGNAHNTNNLPIVIAGSAGGYLRQGASVNLEGQPLGTGNSEAYCTGSDEQIPDANTGSPGGNVPLNKLYVTLLNALGATNAGAPITEFGQVDSNDLEAGITDPGELDALRA